MAENPNEDVSENPNVLVENVENPAEEIIDDFVENSEKATRNPCTNEVRDDENPCNDKVSLNIFDPVV